MRLVEAGLLLSSSRFLTRLWMLEALEGPGFAFPWDAIRCLYSAAAASTRRSSSASCLFSSSLRTSGDKSCVSSMALRSSSPSPPVASEPAIGVNPPLESMCWSTGVRGGGSRSCSGVFPVVSNRRKASPNLPLTMLVKLPRLLCLECELLRRCL